MTVTNLEKAVKSSNLSLSKKTVIHIMYSATVVTEKLTEVLKSHELTLPQYNVLRILRGQKGNSVNLFMIQERMITPMSNTTRLVDKLIEKELAERQLCETNRRKVEIRITAKGLALLTVLEPLVDQVENNLIKELTPAELEKLNTLLDKVNNNKSE